MKKLLSFTLTTVGVILSLQITAEAYIDPSVTTYAIQAVAGVLVAIGAFVAIYWRRAKKKVTKNLRIDENKNKEVEEDIVIFAENNEDMKKK